MNIVLIDPTTKFHSLRALNAWGRMVQDTAPCSLREIVLTIVIRVIIGCNLVGYLQVFAEHDVVRYVLIGLCIIRKFEEQWLVEGATLFVEHADLGVVVVEEGEFGLHRSSNEMNIALGWEINRFVLEYIRFLRSFFPSVVIDRERMEGTDVVPAGTECIISITGETTDV